VKAVQNFRGIFSYNNHLRTVGLPEQHLYTPCRHLSIEQQQLNEINARWNISVSVVQI